MGQTEQKREYSRKRKRKNHGTPCWLLIVMLIIDLSLLCMAGRCLYHFFHTPGSTYAASGTEDAGNISEQNKGNGINWKEGKEGSEKEDQGMELNAELAAECRQLYEANQDLLVLVNKEYALTDTWQVSLKLLQNKRVKVADIMYQDLKEMLTDASEYGYSYALVSGYRDADYQQKLIQNDVQRYIRQQHLSQEEALERTYEQVMPAGHSEHETGLAIDITASGNTALDESQAEEAEIQWLHENCWKYGFILRYPEDKESITQISYEPWHFRYVGREAAEFLYEHNLTLEEFHEYL